MTELAYFRWLRCAEKQRLTRFVLVITINVTIINIISIITININLVLSGPPSRSSRCVFFLVYLDPSGSSAFEPSSGNSSG